MSKPRVLSLLCPLPTRIDTGISGQTSYPLQQVKCGWKGEKKAAETIANYWSSSPYVSAANNSNNAWLVNFNNGNVNNNNRNNNHRVRLVRSGK